MILATAGAFYAVALAIAARAFIESMAGRSLARTVVPMLFLALLSSAWALRAINAHMGLRVAAVKVRTEWAYIDSWLERNPEVLGEPGAVEMKRHLQEDAVRKHPLRPKLAGRWLEWFND